jgi:hypothetical protein
MSQTPKQMADNVAVLKRRLKQRLEDYQGQIAIKKNVPVITSSNIQSLNDLYRKCEELTWVIKEVSSLFNNK